MNKQLNILIACEESQAVCKAFREQGFNAFSCDIKECSGNHPEWHFLDDAFNIIENKGGVLQNKKSQYVSKWHLLIAHPPCTFLSNAGALWLHHPKFPNRIEDQKKAIDFFMKFINSNIEHIAVENPVGIISKVYRPANQYVHPYYFGDEATKKTGLWLKNLPLLTPTNMVGKGEMITLKNGKKVSKWFNECFLNKCDAETRRTIRSKTFKGIADAMAKQWGDYINSIYIKNQIKGEKMIKKHRK